MEQTVEQGAIAHIRLAYDGYGYYLLQSIAGVEGVGEGRNILLVFFGSCMEFAAVGTLKCLADV